MTNRGFSLISVMVSMVITGIFATTISSVIVLQSKGTHSVSRKLETLAVDSAILNVLGAEDTCTCQLDTYNINTTNPSDINLGILRSGCDTTTPDNIIVEANQPLKNATAADITVDSVKVTRIVPTGLPDAYEADLVVEYTAVDRTLRPTSLSMMIFIDPSLGSATARPIKRCLGGGGKLGSPCLFTDDTTRVAYMGCGDTAAAGGVDNAFLGLASGPNNTGNQNTFIGAFSGNANTTGTNNVYIGGGSGESGVSLDSNTFVGFESGQNNTLASGSLVLLLGLKQEKEVQNAPFL